MAIPIPEMRYLKTGKTALFPIMETIVFGSCSVCFPPLFFDFLMENWGENRPKTEQGSPGGTHGIFVGSHDLTDENIPAAYGYVESICRIFDPLGSREPGQTQRVNNSRFSNMLNFFTRPYGFDYIGSNWQPLWIKDSTIPWPLRKKTGFRHRISAECLFRPDCSHQTGQKMC